ARGALAASPAEGEKSASWPARWPKPTTAIWSDGRFAVTKARAASTASASGRPAIDCERSMARTTLLVEPRLVAWRPETGKPASRSVGGRDTGLPVMTVTRMSGYDPVSMLWMVTPAAAGAAATAAGVTASARVRRRGRHGRH